MSENNMLSSNSLSMSFAEQYNDEDSQDNIVGSDDEMTLDKMKYDKIGIFTDLNDIKESDAIIKYVDNVKYYNNYKLIGKLGQGSLCKVKLVEYNNMKFALKIVNKKVLNQKKEFKKDDEGKLVKSTPLEGILKEIAILKKVNHQNLVRLYEIMHNKKKGKIYLVLEYCEHGDLMTFNEETSTFTVNKFIYENYTKNKDNKDEIEKFYYSESQIRRFVRQIIKGINYLHRIGIVHKDIKPNNILLNKNNECKII